LIVLLLCAAAHGQISPATASQLPPDALPDSPGAVLVASLSPPPSPSSSNDDSTPPIHQQSVIVLAEASFAADNARPVTCHNSIWWHPRSLQPASSDSDAITESQLGCINPLNPFDRFLNTTIPVPMTPRQKGYLALHNLADPFNLATIIATSGITIAADSHTAYGPGVGGFGLSVGVSLLQDATGEFFGTFLIPSIAHEDPHYRRMPNASIPRRIVYAISRTVIGRNDNGSPMPAYSTLLTYPITAELSNLYVPGIKSNGPSTAERILVGYATDPVNNLITEFLPDVARRVHVRIIFVQQIINQVAANPPGSNP
jgi:hypothetical protein